MRGGRWEGMGDQIWFDLGETHAVLEFDASPEGRALELHVVVQSDGSGTVAWWESESGLWLGAADVATC